LGFHPGINIKIVVESKKICVPPGDLFQAVSLVGKNLKKAGSVVKL
jgi:hypothetical protein